MDKKCVSCERYLRHYAKGFCRSCYDKQPEHKARRKLTTNLWDKTDRAKESFKKYRDGHSEQLKESCKEWRKKNPHYSAEYHHRRFQTDPSYKLAFTLRRRVRYVLKNNKKADRIINLIGCSIEQLWQHLEKQFQLGMTRQNHGLWHIDHIKPLASFDLSEPQQQYKAFHYTNLQPLWAKDNLNKSKKIVYV